jgi:phosphoenolpyruvate-protein phosphotransferase
LERAIDEVKSGLAVAMTRLQASGAKAEAGILEAQSLMLEDPVLLETASSLIRGGASADVAVATAMAPYAEMLRSSVDPVFQGRAADLDDVVEQIRRSLHGVAAIPPAPDRPSIVVARDLAPSQTAGLDRDLVVGFATEQGTATAHTAILARALGLPAVVGIAGLMEHVADRQLLLLDGDTGRLLIDPPADEVAALGPVSGLRADSAPAVTRDGRQIEVACNVANLADARRAAEAGADGIGLLRSEFLFLGRDRLPTEDEQFAMLVDVVRAMEGRPVILRTLDVGADKPLPALPQPPEMNPALGVRGLRLQLLRRPDLLLDQVRAALRLSREHKLRLMFPMVSTVEEIRAARGLLRNAAHATGIDPLAMEVGIMIEVPSAALMADRLAKEVDFFSLGTNDLTQYVFAADRTNPELASLADSLHPAVLRLIDQVVRAAHAEHRWVGVCGEMASDVRAVPILVGLGVDELSVHPPRVAPVKATVRGVAEDMAQIAAAALNLEDGEAVRSLLDQYGSARQ